uniref:Large ribosomal subunit protein uL29 n=1 Tax=candidate division WOR-3 bacterium TaxID=2052148 RepID=A0A7C4XK61_UNCW3
MKVFELREKTREELTDLLNGLYRELFNLKIRRASQELPNPLRLRTIRRDIARIRTILRESELGKVKLLEGKKTEVKTKKEKGEKNA